jgi:EAL domain-containing protein (putative c-di-GMP-specific phosphodiesterase class I)/PAS domain-containing protein
MDAKQKETIQNPDSKLLLNQVDCLYKNLNYSNWSIALISSFLVWVLWPVANHTALLYWDAYILFVTLCREHLAYLYTRAQKNEDNIKIWLNIYVGGVFFSGLGWGLQLILVVPPEQTIHLIAAVFLLGGLVTGSAATLSSLKYSFAVFSIPAILPGALYLISIDRELTFVIGCSLFLFLVFILFIALRMHKTVFYSLKKQFEVSNLLSVIEAEKIELEEKIVSLEDQLQFDHAEFEKIFTTLKHKQSKNVMVRNISDFDDERFTSLLGKSIGGVWDMNIKSGQMKYCDSWLGMLGYEASDIVNDIPFWEDLLHPEDKLEVLNKLQNFATGNNHEFSSSYRLKNKAGEWIWVVARAQGVIWGDTGELLQVVGAESIIPESSEMLKNTLDLIHFDLNEWLASYDEFNNRLLKLIKTASVEGIQHTFWHIHIIEMSDNSKENSSLTEISLYEAGRVLFNEFREGDAIIRTGKDSFGLIMEFCGIEDAWEKAIRLQKAFSNQEINYKGTSSKLTTSIGITPIVSEHSTIESIQSDSKHASALAIHKTSNHIFIYQKDSQELPEKIVEKMISRQIEESISQNELQITVTKLENISLNPDTLEEEVFIVNVKFDNESIDAISEFDNEFIAKNSYLSSMIDCYAIERLLIWMKNNRTSTDNTKQSFIYESIGNTFISSDYQAFLERTLPSLAVANKAICFGISEKVLLNNKQETMQFIEKVNEKGCKIALTDVGYNSLSATKIKELSINFLKFDSSIIKEIEKDQGNYLTIKYINDIIHLSGLNSIIEIGEHEILPESIQAMSIDYVLGMDSVSKNWQSGKNQSFQPIRLL